MMVNLQLNQSNLIWTFFFSHLQTVAADVAATRTAKHNEHLELLQKSEGPLDFGFLPLLNSSYSSSWSRMRQHSRLSLSRFCVTRKKTAKNKNDRALSRVSRSQYFTRPFFPPRSLFTVSLVELTEKGNTCSLTDDCRQRSAEFCRKRGRKAAAQVNL